VGKALTKVVASGMSYPASSPYGLPVGAGRLTGRERAVGPSWGDDGMIFRVSRAFTRHQSAGNPHGARRPVLLSLPVSVQKAVFKKASARMHGGLSTTQGTWNRPGTLMILLKYHGRIAPQLFTCYLNAVCFTSPARKATSRLWPALM
jgi:hypothetical protein